MDSKFYRIGNQSDIGLVREINEDSLGTFEAEWGGVFVVCDGIGGQTGGDVASKIATETIINTFAELHNEFDVNSALLNAFNNAKMALMQVAEKNSMFNSMGTTVAVFVLQFSQATLAYLGDSRIYLWRNGKLYLLTKDHSFVQNLLDLRKISSKQASSHPMKNLITKALGVASNFAPDISIPIKTFIRDKILICSDGLTNFVSEDIISETLKLNAPQTASNILVNLAIKGGGDDNISVYVVEIIEGTDLPFDKETPPEFFISRKEVKKKHNLLFLYFFLFLVVLSFALAKLLRS